jgi:hypothetical protein
VVCQDVETLQSVQVRVVELQSCNISVTATIDIVHPKATIFAIAGPIVIGTGCIIEEGAIIVNRSTVTSIYPVIDAHRRKEAMRIGTMISLKSVVVRLLHLPYRTSHLNSKTNS